MPGERWNCSSLLWGGPVHSVSWPPWAGQPHGTQTCMQACVICHGQSYQRTVVQWLPLAPPTECPNTLSFQLRLKEEELRDYQRAEDEALTKRQLLEQALKDLEYELEAKSHLKDDRSRLIKQMEVCGYTGRSRAVEHPSGPLGNVSSVGGLGVFFLFLVWRFKIFYVVGRWFIILCVRAGRSEGCNLV